MQLETRLLATRRYFGYFFQSLSIKWKNNENFRHVPILETNHRSIIYLYCYIISFEF